MLRKAVACRTAVKGIKFLQAIHEKPEFVCTCCHRWLFHQSIMHFDESKYDTTNDIVKETLDTKYHHPMYITVVKGTHSAHGHPINYEDSDDDSDSELMDPTHENTATQKNEYIYMTCHNNLKRKKPKMPAQACANGLALPEIPHELLNLSDMECRIIALRIPFMVIFCLVRYGNQYKI